ncbi:hypothetical protein ACJX0J_029596 [Zea mays]
MCIFFPVAYPIRYGAASHRASAYTISLYLTNIISLTMYFQFSFFGGGGERDLFSLYLIIEMIKFKLIINSIKITHKNIQNYSLLTSSPNYKLFWTTFESKFRKLCQIRVNEALIILDNYIKMIQEEKTLGTSDNAFNKA